MDSDSKYNGCSIQQLESLLKFQLTPDKYHYQEFFIFIHLEKVYYMKNFFFFLSSLSLLFSCAPEKTMNRKIDGTWTLISVNNLSPIEAEKVTFEPEGRNGTITYQKEKNGQVTDSIGTYSIMKYEFITTSFKDNSKLGFNETVFSFTKCTENELTLTQQNGVKNVYIFKKVE